MEAVKKDTVVIRHSKNWDGGNEPTNCYGLGCNEVLEGL